MRASNSPPHEARNSKKNNKKIYFIHSHFSKKNNLWNQNAIYSICFQAWSVSTVIPVTLYKMNYHLYIKYTIADETVNMKLGWNIKS